jgi:hypothetical protein
MDNDENRNQPMPRINISPFSKVKARYPEPLFVSPLTVG